jgi:thioredoxin 1
MRHAGLISAGLAAVGLGAAIYLLQGQSQPQPSAAQTPVPDAVQQALRAGKPTVVEFGASACASCREMKPILAQLAREYGHRIAVVDIDLIKNTDYIRAYKIQLMPTQVFFDAQGRETGRNVGTISAPAILARLEGGAR